MIATTAIALDNHFRIVVVLTSDNNRLVDQTRDDFRAFLPGVLLKSKLDISDRVWESEARTVKRALETSSTSAVVIVTSKGAQVLSQVNRFLGGIGAHRFPAVTFDDEGDQASLDTNALRRARSGEEIEPSTIHRLVHGNEAGSLRSNLPFNAFLSVTGTPQGIVLQNLGSKSRPNFIFLMEAGSQYVGGDEYFGESDEGRNNWISLIDDTERLELLDHGNEIPIGLKRAICRFILNATALAQVQGWREYKMLIHPGVRQQEHAIVQDLLYAFIDGVHGAIADLEADENQEIRELFECEYQKLLENVPDLSPLAELTDLAGPKMSFRTVSIVNAKTSQTQLSYTNGFNYLIGGNSVGRGLAFPHLLVTYYVRESRRPSMDTIYQHARMFGYRRSYLAFTQVFLPLRQYDNFQRTVKADKDLRLLITERGDDVTTLLLNSELRVRPTRSNVLDARNIETVLPATQLYPNLPIYRPPVSVEMRDKVLALLAEYFPDYELNGSQGIDITAAQAQKLLSLIRTESTNAWNDRQAQNILGIVATVSSNSVRLRYRTATTRRIVENGRLSTGILGGRVSELADDTKPVLWIVDVDAANATWEDKKFVYPTIVLPRSMKPRIFNKS